MIAVETGQILRLRRIEDFREALFDLRLFARGWRGGPVRCAGASGQQNESERKDAEWSIRALEADRQVRPTRRATLLRRLDQDDGDGDSQSSPLPGCRLRLTRQDARSRRKDEVDGKRGAVACHRP